jgi:hypothetical protein
MDKDWSSKILDKELMLRHLDEILKIERDTSSRLGKDAYGSPWLENNFLSDRKGKWKFSTAVILEGKLLSYLVSSQWLNNLHGHRMAMQIDLATETKILLQKELYHKQQEILKSSGIKLTTAMVPEKNLSTIKYYLKEGWVELNKEELLEFIKGRDMQCHIEDINTLVDDFPEEGHPSRAKVLKFITK